MKTFVAQQTGVRWKTLAAELRRAAKSPEDVEAIHDLRVSIRRFRQCLRTFGDFFDKASVKKVSKPLRRLMRQCGAVRNCDISIEMLEAVGLDGDPAIAMLRERRAEEERILAKTLKETRSNKLKWKERSRNPPPKNLKDLPWDLEQPPAVNARLVLPPMFTDLVTAGKAAIRSGASYEEIHRFRIQAKRFRYTVELFETFYGEDVAKGLVELKALQDRLGELNDCVTALELLPRRRRARAAIQKLLKERERAFRSSWKQRFSPQALQWWRDWLRAAPGETK